VPTVMERLTVSVNTGGLDQQIAGQVGALQQAIALAGPLLEGRTPAIGTLVGSLGALRSPSFNSGSFGGALSGALALVPSDLASVVAPVGGRFGEMGTLVDDQLKPLLERAVNTARAIQQLLSLRLGCVDGIPGATASSAPPPPPAPGDPPPPTRVAVAAQQIQQIDTMLSGLPPTLDAATLVQLLLALLATKPRDRFFTINVPVLDDFLDPLYTLSAWSALDNAGVAAHVVGSIDALSARVRESAALPLADLAASLNATAPQWRRVALGTAADAIADNLIALDTALGAGNDAAAATALTALNTALDDYDALRIAMGGDVLAAAPVLRARLVASPVDMLDALTHLLVLVEPTNVAAKLTGLIPPVEPVPPEAIQAIQDAVQPVIDWLDDVTGLLDFGGVQTEIAEVAATAQALAADIESELTGVGVNVQSAFAEVSEAIAGIGLDDLRNELTAQIAQFGEQIERDITRAFEPAREGAGAAIDAVSDALDSFDPQVIVDALQDVVDGIAGVLSGPEVAGAIDQVRQAVDAVVEALRALSFQPVTDEVIALIDEMRNGLKAIIDTELNDATKAALGAAMSVLPGDLHPVTDPIVEEFGELVDAGPLMVLNRVKDAPQRLLDEVKRFEPAALVGDQLSGPYRQLLDRADSFSASQLFAAADTELARARQRLIDTARPSRALEPLRAPVQALFARLDAFSAEALLAPLTGQVEEAIARIIEASPVDEILGAINGVFDTIRDVLTFAQRIQSVANRVRQLFEAFVDADEQFDAWRDELLGKLPGAGDAQVVNALSALTTALDAARHADVLAAFDAAAAAAVTELDGLNAGPRLSRIVSAYGRVATRVPGLPASPTRDAAQLLLARFNPTQPLHSAPLRAAGEMRTAIASARTALVAMAIEWTDTANGFAPLRNVDAATLRDLVSAQLEPVLQPVRFLFRSLGNVAAPVAGIVETLTELITTLTARVDALVTGPGSLSAISGAVQNVVDALRNIDLDFLGRSLDEVLLTVRDQLRALDPATLGAELDDAFEQALSALSLSTIIPAEDVEQLDAAWQSVIDKLRALDPGDLVEDALQPIWDDTVLPLLDAFDLTPVFAALIEFLESLKSELSGGLDEVNTAYQSLIALRPGGGASASIGT
jgi:hypothetical protein